MNHHWSYVRVCVCRRPPSLSFLLFYLPQRIDCMRSSTSVFFSPLFSFPIFRWQQLPFIPSKRGFHTSRGLDSHSLPDVVRGLGCSCRRRAHTRGAERAQVFLRALPTASTRCGFSKHMTSTITSMGALNRLKFCTYVARQQRNRSPYHHHHQHCSPTPLYPALCWDCCAAIIENG